MQRAWLRYLLLCLLATANNSIASNTAAVQMTASEPLTAVSTADFIRPQLEQRADIVAKLEALRPGEAVELGEAAVVGEFNATARQFGLHRHGPRARDYSIKMAWAAERKRALFAGANHQVPHRLNDVWEFDLGALSWILLYPPDKPRSYAGLGEDGSDVVFAEGVLRTDRGGPAIVGHTWWGITYHPGLRRMLWMNAWVADESKLLKQLGEDPAQRYKGLPLWSFDPQQARWELLRTTGPAPKAIFGGLLEYVDLFDDVIWHANNWQMRGSWRLGARHQQWQDLGARGEGGSFAAQAARAEQVAYHDPRRRLIVAQGGRDTFHLDLQRMAWRKVRTEPKDSDEVPNGHDARTPFVYDSTTGEGLLLEFRTGQIWAYNPDTQEWSRRKPQGPLMPTGKKRLAYFDHQHGVLVVIDGRKIWAYRNSKGD